MITVSMSQEEFQQRLDSATNDGKRIAARQAQIDLANASGVGQPAISMMLSRNCRPQKRTVIRIAAALGISPGELWSD